MATKRKPKKKRMHGVKISRVQTKRFSLKQAISDARKNGFKAKKPKKPKTKTVTSLQNYIDRYNEWVKSVKDNAADYKKLKHLSGVVSKM